MNSNELLAEYRQNGVVFPLPALSKSEAWTAQQQYTNLCDPGEVVAKDERRIFGHLLHPWIASLVSHPSILEAVRCLIGPNILVWVSEFNAKAPHTSNFFSWHQDLYYWKLRYGDLSTIPMVTTWLALSSADAYNGCMQVLPGSHTQLVSHVENPDEYNLLTRAQEIRIDVDARKTIPINLSAGEFSIHHPMLHHASGPNMSSSARVGLVTRYMAPEVIPPLRPAYTWLVSGEDKHGNWDHIAPINAITGPKLKQKCMESVQQITGAGFK